MTGVTSLKNEKDFAQNFDVVPVLLKRIESLGGQTTLVSAHKKTSVNGTILSWENKCLVMKEK